MPSRPRVLARALDGAMLTKRGIGFLVAAGLFIAAAYIASRQEFLVVGVLLGVLPLAALIYVRVTRPRVDVSRVFSPGVIAAGQTTEVTLVARNLAARRSARAQWQDALPWYPFATPPTPLPALHPRGGRFTGRGNTVALRYELTPERRGLFEIGPFIVGVGDPFGLATSVAEEGTPHLLVVTPEIVSLTESGLSVGAGDGESRVVQRRAAGDEDDIMTREYRRGDAMRRVHWRASARHGDLMVRQEEQRSLPEARILIDTRADGYDDEGSRDDEIDSGSFEWAVRMLASVAVHLRRTGFHVEISESAPPQLDVRSRARTWGDEDFLVELATLDLIDAPAGFEPEPVPGRSRGPVVALISVPDDHVLEWVIAQRAAGELGVAFLARDLTTLDHLDRTFGIPSRAPEIVERLTDAGWLVVPVRADDDHAAAWEAVVSEMGRARDLG